MRYTKPKTATKNDSPDIIKDTLRLVFNLWATPITRMRAKIMFEDPYNYNIEQFGAKALS